MTAVVPLKYHCPGFRQETERYELIVWLPNEMRPGWTVSYCAAWDGDDWGLALFDKFGSELEAVTHLQGLPIDTEVMIAAVTA